MFTPLSASPRLACMLLPALLGGLARPAQGLEQDTSCLHHHAAERAVISLRREGPRVTVEHICASWQAPLQIEGVRVLATDLAEDAGPAVAVLLVEQHGQAPFERRVQVGDRVGERWVVVAARDGIVLFDGGGTLLAALDQRPVAEWRLTWHSPFGVAGLSAPPVAAPPAGAVKPGKVAPAKKAMASERPKPKVRAK
jgi:hypothetical protein